MNNDDNEDSLFASDDGPLTGNHVGTEDLVGHHNNSDSSNSSLPSKSSVISVVCDEDESRVTHSLRSTQSSCSESFGIEEITTDCGDNNNTTSDNSTITTTNNNNNNSSNINRRLKKADLLLNSFIDKIPLRKMTFNSPSTPTKSPVNNNNNNSNNNLSCDNLSSKNNNTNDSIISNSDNNNNNNNDNNDSHSNKRNSTDDISNRRIDKNTNIDLSTLRKVAFNSPSTPIKSPVNNNNSNNNNNNTIINDSSELPEFQLHECDGHGKKTT